MKSQNRPNDNRRQKSSEEVDHKRRQHGADTGRKANKDGPDSL